MRHWHWLMVAAVGLIGANAVSRGTEDGGFNFDKLSDTDRKVLEERFVKEVWPLLARGGKDGCVGCHSGKIVSDLKFSKDPVKDFRMLVKEGFFEYDDRGNLYARVAETDPKRRMPKDLPAWAKGDIETLKSFTHDLDKKQKRK